MPKKEVIIQEFNQALTQLKKALDQPKDEFIRDSAIQRFEFCFDLCWKSLKTVLEDDYGIICNSPKECFRQAYSQKMIKYSESWLEMTDLRNKTAHTYSEKTAEEIFDKLPQVYQKLTTLSQSLQKTKSRFIRLYKRPIEKM